MATNVTVKKSRSARASDMQLVKMIDFFNLNKGLAEGKFQVINGKEEAKKKWAEMAEELNLMKGTTKTSDQWQVVWRDLKSRTSLKARNLRKAKAATGNKAIDETGLTEFDLRVIGVVGSEYVEGNKNCADTLPEEEDLQVQLNNGDTSVLRMTPQVPSITSDVLTPLENYSFENDVEMNSIERSVLDDTRNIGGSSSSSYSFQNNVDTNPIVLPALDAIVVLNDDGPNEQENQPPNLYRTPKAPASSYLRGSKRKVPFNPTEVASNSRNIGGSSSSMKRARKLDEVESTPDQFRSISEEHAKAMMMLADASKIQADASMITALAVSEMAKAVQKLADTAAAQAVTDAERTPIMAQLVKVLSNLLPTDLYEQSE